MKGKYAILALLFIAVLFVSSGCGKETADEAEFNIYYVDKDNTKIVPVAYDPPEGPASGSDTAVINDMILKLCKEPDSVDYRRPIPKDVELVSWTLNERQLRLNFGTDYSTMDNVTEVLCRAAFVRTLTQMDTVDCVSFYVGDTPLMDAKGNPVGLMTSDSFVENPGEQINSIQTATLKLYFSNKKGTGLVPEEIKDVYYSSNISMEKLVLEYLLKGPKDKELKSAIPAGTKMVGVSVLDGVCFVNLDEGFLNQNYEVSEGVVIYSIVNSLVELPNVNKVQISVNGDTSITYRDKFPLSGVYERNLDYLESSKTQDGEILKEIQLQPAEDADD